MLHAQQSTNLLQIYMDTHASERQISLQWQGVASSRDDRDVLRLAPRASSWAHTSESWPIHVEGDASSSLSKISIRLISDVGTSPASCVPAMGSGSPRRRRHPVRHCGGGGRSHASFLRPMTSFSYATPPAIPRKLSRSARVCPSTCRVQYSGVGFH